MNLILVFSVGTAGTVLKALRLWKSVAVWRVLAQPERAARWQHEVA